MTIVERKPMQIRSLNKHSLSGFIKNKGTYNVLYVKLNHCGACERGRPRFISIERNHADRKDIVFAEFTVEDAQSAKLLCVKNVPTVKVYKDEECVYANHGLSGIADLDEFLGKI